MAGRPTKRTPEIEDRLRHAFSIGATISEACFYADIGEATYYEWVQKDPEFAEQMNKLRNKPILKARENIAKKIANGDSDISKWYLERKRKAEFSTRSEQETKDTSGQDNYLSDIEAKKKAEQILGYETENIIKE